MFDIYNSALRSLDSNIQLQLESAAALVGAYFLVPAGMELNSEGKEKLKLKQKILHYVHTEAKSKQNRKNIKLY